MSPLLRAILGCILPFHLFVIFCILQSEALRSANWAVLVIRLGLGGSVKASSFPEGIAIDFETVSIVDQAIQKGIRNGRDADQFIPG